METDTRNVPEWRVWHRYPEYEISSVGGIRTKRNLNGTGYYDFYRYIKPTVGTNGYHVFGFTRHSGGKVWSDTFLLHNVVAEVFLGARPHSLLECHRDSDKDNNSVSNLYYGTNSQNMMDKVEAGTSNRGERCAASRITELQAKEIKARLATGEKSSVIAIDYPISAAGIRKIKRGDTWSHLTVGT